MSDYTNMLLTKDNAKAIDMFAVLVELSLKEDAIKCYIDYVCTKLIYYESTTSYNDKDKFREEHWALNERICLVFQSEMTSAGKGRILEVFGGELWYRIILELINRYFKQEYKKFIQEALDTEGKSKQLFLEILDVCI